MPTRPPTRLVASRCALLRFPSVVPTFEHWPVELFDAVPVDHEHVLEHLLGGTLVLGERRWLLTPEQVARLRDPENTLQLYLRVEGELASPAIER